MGSSAVQPSVTSRIAPWAVAALLLAACSNDTQSAAQARTAGVGGESQPPSAGAPAASSSTQPGAGANADAATKQMAHDLDAIDAANNAQSSPGDDQAGKGAAAEPAHYIGGADRVDIAQYAVAGQTTIFDFYSEYCGPCRMFSPYLERLDKSRGDIVVIKVDINRPGVRGIDWGSPVARQYQLTSIPHFKIFGPDGKLVSEGDTAYRQVVGWIQQLEG